MCVDPSEHEGARWSGATDPASAVRRSAVPLVAGGAVLAVILGLLGAIPEPGRLSGDSRRYLRMVADPSVLQEPPWGFRIGVPWLAHVLPMSPGTTIALVNLTALALSTVLMALFVRRESDDRRAWMAVGLFLVSGAVHGVIREGLVDMPAIAIILGCLVLGRYNRWWAIPPLLAIGMAVKEPAAMVLLPLGIMAMRGPGRTRRLAAVAVAALLGGAVYFVIRSTSLVFGQGAGRQGFSPLSIVDVLHYQQVHQGSVARSAANAVYAQVGVLLVPVLLGLWRARGWTLALVSLMAPIALTLLFATDWARLFGYSVLVVVPVVCAIGRPSVVAAVSLVAATAVQVELLPYLHGPVKGLLLAGAFLLATLAALHTFRTGAEPPSTAHPRGDLALGLPS